MVNIHQEKISKAASDIIKAKSSTGSRISPSILLDRLSSAKSNLSPHSEVLNPNGGPKVVHSNLNSAKNQPEPAGPNPNDPIPTYPNPDPRFYQPNFPPPGPNQNYQFQPSNMPMPATFAHHQIPPPATLHRQDNINLEKFTQIENLTKDLLKNHDLDPNDSSLNKLKQTITLLSTRLAESNEKQYFLSNENNYLKRTMLLVEDISSHLNPEDIGATDLMNRLIACKFENTRLLTDLENIKAELANKDEIMNLEISKSLNQLKEKYTEKIGKFKKLDLKKKNLIEDQEKLIKKLEIEIEKLREKNKELVDFQEELQNAKQKFGDQETLDNALMGTGTDSSLGNNNSAFISFQQIRENNNLAMQNFTNLARIQNLKNQVENYKNIAENKKNEVEEIKKKLNFEVERSENIEKRMQKSAVRWSNERGRLMMKLRHEKFKERWNMRNLEDGGEFAYDEVPEFLDY